MAKTATMSMRFWLSQNHSDFAQLRISGNRPARSGRETGLMRGSSNAASGAYPCSRSVSE